jgi:hypothetical protein
LAAATLAAGVWIVGAGVLAQAVASGELWFDQLCHVQGRWHSHAHQHLLSN